MLTYHSWWLGSLELADFYYQCLLVHKLDHYLLYELALSCCVEGAK